MTSGEQQLWQAHLERGALLADLRAIAAATEPFMRAMRSFGIAAATAAAQVRRFAAALDRQATS